MTAINMHQPDTVTTDILVIGSGASGLINAIALANDGYNVIVSTKEAVTESSSAYAQGGIAVACTVDDSIDKHIQDTIKAGGELCDPVIVKSYISQIYTCLKQLESWGIHFEGLDNQEELLHESGHSHRRIVHVGSSGISGRLLMKMLWELALRHPRISVAQGNVLTKLLTNQSNQCIGGIFVDMNCNLITILAKYTVMASGGYSQLYSKSTNPESNTGDGVILASNIGAELQDIHLVQFHPTAYQYANNKYFLLSETLRGEGAVLINKSGSRFLSKYYPDTMEMAYRSQISTAIYTEIQNNPDEQIYLDLSNINSDIIHSRFQAIYQSCLEWGHNIIESPIPITPVAHYAIGGIKTDKYSQTNIANLYAIGECSNNRLHGKERLASNSLLECIVSAFVVHDQIKQQVQNPVQDYKYNYSEEYAIPATYYNVPKLTVEHNIQELKAKMWQYCSFAKTNDKLQILIDYCTEELTKYSKHIYLTDTNINNYKNNLMLCKLIAEASIQ